MTTPIAETSLEDSDSDSTFDISPSQAIYAPYYAAHGLAFLLIIAAGVESMRLFPALAHVLWWCEIVASALVVVGIFTHAVSVTFTRYTLDSKRLTMRYGFFGRSITSLELFRIQDVNFVQTWWQEMLGIGTLVILTSDQYHPREVLVGVRNGPELREQLTRAATAIRRNVGIREITVGK